MQDQSSPRGTPLGTFALRDSAVDTSGVYECCFVSGGKRYAHIMDTRTGRPVEVGPHEKAALSATVALPRDRNSDGPALVLLVLGPKEGVAFADSLHLAAVLLDGDKKVYLSKAARPIFTLIDTSYSIQK